MRSSSRSVRHQEFLPPILEIEETPPSRFGRSVIWLVALLLALAVAWSYLGEVDQYAVARGRLVPDAKMKVVQARRDGRIQRIHVREGDRVAAGQVLVELDPTLADADAETTRRAVAIHRSTRRRLLAELRGDERVGGDSGDDLLGLQRSLKSAREQEYAARRRAMLLEAAARANQLEEARARLGRLERELPFVREQEEMYARLHEHGIASRLELSERRRAVVALEAESAAQAAVVAQREAGLREVETRVEGLQREREQAILTELVEVERRLAALEGEEIKAAKEREFDRLESPVDGYVQELAFQTVGGVVGPGQPVVTLVPDGTPLVAEAKVLNRDIGFVRVGQTAEIKVDTFPFQKYGTIPGTVLSLSPDAMEDDRLGPVYLLRAGLEAEEFLSDRGPGALVPGMALSVEVRTGKRRVLEFFLSPLVKYARESLTVR